MSQQGPIIVIAREGRPAFADVLAEAAAFPVVETTWNEVPSTIKKLKPALIVAEISDGCADQLNAVANYAHAAKPYLPLIIVGELASPPANALPFDDADPTFARRLRAPIGAQDSHPACNCAAAA